MNTSTNRIVKFRSLGIRGQLLSGFAIIIGILILAITFTLSIVTTTKQTETNLLQMDLPTYNMFLEVDKHIYELTSALRGWILSHDPKFKMERETTLVSLERLEANIDELAKHWNNERFIKNWEEIKILLRQFNHAQNRVVNIADQAEAVRTLMTDPVVLYSKILTILNGPVGADGLRSGGILGEQYQKVHLGVNKIIYDMNLIETALYVFFILFIISSISIALITAKKILTPLNNAIDIAQKIASGERNLVIDIQSNDETGELLSALKTMQESIKNNEDKLQESKENTRRLFEEIVQTANTFSEHSSKVAAGDLTQRLVIDRADEMSKLGKDLNNMTEGLALITKKITEAANNMALTIDDVKQASARQSSGVSEQAASIQQITASLEEIDKSAAQTMEKAKILGKIAEQTTQKGQMGSDAVEQSIEGMKSIREKVQTIAKTILELSNQTQQVGEITAVVNTLAQQSKMLALNASIEAAKAGEAGKGFAVVAAEVKNLAEQSEQSTTQVQKILEDIRHATEKAVFVTEEGTKGVDQGTKLVEQMGGIVHSLTETINETMIASQQIEAAVRQESLGIEQITAGMNEINQVTSSFVDTVVQTTESIGQLASIATSMKGYVDVYKI